MSKIKTKPSAQEPESTINLEDSVEHEFDYLQSFECFENICKALMSSTTPNAFTKIMTPEPEEPMISVLLPIKVIDFLVVGITKHYYEKFQKAPELDHVLAVMTSMFLSFFGLGVEETFRMFANQNITVSNLIIPTAGGLNNVH